MIRFACPQCKQPLAEVDRGYTCAEHGQYDTSRGIPYLMTGSPQESADYFEEHWTTKNGADYPPTKLQVAREFLAPLLEPSIRADTVLDVGCGDGVHAKALDELDSNRLEYFGIDISAPALATATTRNTHATFAISAAEFLPFEDGAFDVCFSYGVLAYTSSARRSFEEMVRVTKRGGMVGVWFYRKPDGLPGLALDAVRRLTRIAPKLLLSLVANSIVPFLPLLPTSSGVSLRNATWAQCKEVVLVNIAPHHLWYPTEDEVTKLFRDSNIEIRVPAASPDITIWGVKE